MRSALNLLSVNNHPNPNKETSMQKKAPAHQPIADPRTAGINQMWI